MYGTPAPSAESQLPDAWPAGTYGHLRESADFLQIRTLINNSEFIFAIYAQTMHNLFVKASKNVHSSIIQIKVQGVEMKTNISVDFVGTSLLEIINYLLKCTLNLTNNFKSKIQYTLYSTTNPQLYT